MPRLPRDFPHLASFQALSPNSLQAHLRLYQGYIAKYNDLLAKLRTSQSFADSAESPSLKADLTYALAAIKNHELYFDSLGPPPPSANPPQPLADALTQSFRSLPQFLADLRQTALASRTWAFTACDLDDGLLINYPAAHDGLPVPDTYPILALDLYGHAYFYDFGANKAAYLDTLLKNLHWPNIATRLATAQQLHATLHPSPPP